MNKYRKEEYIVQRRNPSGRYTFQVRIRTGNRDLIKSFSEKAYGSSKLAFDAAIMYRDKTLYEIRAGTVLKSSISTVDDMFKKYLATTTDSFKTKRKHTYMYEKYVSHKSTRMQDLTRADIQEDLNRMVDDCSDDTIGKMYSIWKNAIVNTAILNEILNKDVMLGVKKPESKKIHIRKETTTDRATVNRVEELILEHVRDHYDARIINYLIETLYFTGMRPAECLALTRADISNGMISITKEIGSSREESGVIRRCKKPSSVRVIPIHPELKDILDDLMEFSKHDALYMNSNGRYMEIDFISNTISRLCRENGVKFNLYRLRHNMATSLVTNNVDSKTTIEIMGHKNYDMSIYYASSTTELKKDAIKYVS